jgi:hypothetical protein
MEHVMIKRFLDDADDLVSEEQKGKIIEQMSNPAFGFRFAQGVRVSKYANHDFPGKTLYAAVVEGADVLFVYTRKDAEQGLPETEFLLAMVDQIEKAALSYRYN